MKFKFYSACERSARGLCARARAMRFFQRVVRLPREAGRREKNALSARLSRASHFCCSAGIFGRGEMMAVGPGF